MDSYPDTASRSRVWSAVKWTLAVPIFLGAVFAATVGVRYVVGKGRLDRLQTLRDDTLTLHFQQAVPDWVRDWLGDRCEPLERISAVELMSADDESLIRVLPNTPDTESVELWIDEDTVVSGAGLSELANLPTLKRLAIYGDIARLDLSWLPKCQQLEYLRLTIGAPATDNKHPDENRGWSKLLTGLPKLRELIVYDDGELTAEETSTLASIRSLHKVRLNSTAPDLDEDDSTKSWSISLVSLHAEALNVLAAIPNLQNLDLECNELSSGITDRLARFTSLRSLTLRNSTLTDSMLSGIAKCRTLESLTLVNTPISPLDGLGILADCPSLNQLIVRECEIDSEHLPGIAKITQLRSLRIEELSDSIHGLGQMKALVKLEELDLNSDEPIDDIVDAITAMPALHWLRFKSLPSTDHPLQAKLAAGTLPTTLAGEAKMLIREMALQRRMDKDKPAEPTEYSIGERKLLPPDPQRTGFFCFF